MKLCTICISALIADNAAAYAKAGVIHSTIIYTRSVQKIAMYVENVQIYVRQKPLKLSVEKCRPMMFLKKLIRILFFFETSNGGVTISGGEPLYQPEFTSEILRLCKENGIHTAIETSGFAQEKALTAVLSFCDLVLFDIKETNEENHKKFTGVSLTPILKNLHMVNNLGIPFIIRMPIIPGLNDRNEHFSTVKSMSTEMRFCIGVDIMPYHSLGEYKYNLLQREYLLADTVEPDNDTINKWKSNIL